MTGWRTACWLGLVAVMAIAGCRGGRACGDLIYDPEADLCVCPEGTFWDADNGVCVGVDDGGVADAGPDGGGPGEDGGTPDGQVDADACTVLAFHRDSDGDGFGDPADVMQSCTAPEGYVARATDCNDACATCNPDGAEVCDAEELDEDCDGSRNEGCECPTGRVEACPDGTETGECTAGTRSCVDGAWSTCAGVVGPMAETCNGRDDDCDGAIDGALAAAACGTPTRAAQVGCSVGTCTIASCIAEYGNCDDRFDNGCETRLGDPAHCLSCDHSCAFACTTTGCDDAREVVVGGYPFACIRQQTGGVRCWGENHTGVLGSGTAETNYNAESVIGLAASAEEVDAGHGFTCARLLNTGGANIACWGDNDWGQLGAGANTSTDRLMPGPVIPSLVATEIAAGADHACAIVSGNVWCWGRTQSGQCGTTSASNVVLPRQVTGGFASGTRFSAVSAGGRHTCAIASGAVWCWGANDSGQLGNGSTSTSPVTTPVRAIASGATAIALGDSHSCAVVSGAVRCWGDNRTAQCGASSPSTIASPTAIGSLSGVLAVGAGARHTCAVMGDRTLRCWGANDEGQLAHGFGVSGSPVATPQPAMPSGSATPLDGVLSMDGGSTNSCAVTQSGAVWCWGRGLVGGFVGVASRVFAPVE